MPEVQGGLSDVSWMVFLHPWFQGDNRCHFESFQRHENVYDCESGEFFLSCDFCHDNGSAVRHPYGLDSITDWMVYQLDVVLCGISARKVANNCIK